MILLAAFCSTRSAPASALALRSTLRRQTIIAARLLSHDSSSHPETPAAPSHELRTHRATSPLDTLSIRGLRRRTTMNKLRACFRSLGGFIRNVRTTTDPSHCYIQFADAVQARAVLDAARISRPKLEGQLLFIDYVGREVPGPKPNRWLTVSNIPEGANARDVAVAVTAWSDNVRMYGPVEAEVDFGTVEAATQVLEASATKPKTLRGHKLALQYVNITPAQPGDTLRYGAGGLPVDELKAALSPYPSAIKELTPAPKSPGWGWIRFRNTITAMGVLREMSGKRILGVPLYLAVARTPPPGIKRSKRRSSIKDDELQDVLKRLRML